MGLRKRRCLHVLLLMLCGCVLSPLLYSSLPYFSQYSVKISPPLSRRLHWSTNSLPEKWRNCSIPKDTQTLCSTKASKKDVLKACPLEELSQNCALLKEIHGYDKPVDAEEESFPLAFGIKMHTGPEQAEQLLRTIYRPHNVYCIHIDKKADEKVLRVMSAIATCFPNVFLSERISYVYASYDAVRSELRVMACALASNINWKYYINLAAQEFPLKTNLEIIRILKVFNGTNDIESFPMPPRFYHHFKHKYEIINGKLQGTRQQKQPPVFKFPIRKGTQYSVFSRGFVKAIFYDDDARSIMEYFKDTRSPEENVWATINQLPWIPGSYPVDVIHSPKNEHMSRAVVWKSTDPYQCKGRYIRKVCIFVQEDLPWLLQQPNFFVNKFLRDFDPRPAACLEAVLDHKVRSGVSNINLTYYSSLPHIQFRSKNIDYWNVTGG